MSDPQGPRLTWLGQLFVLLFIGACGFGAWALFLKKPINSDPSAPAQPSKSFFGGNSDGAPVEIGIAYGTEKQRWLQWAVEQFAATKDGKNVKVNLIAKGSLEGAQAILAGDQKIHVWSPASALYEDVFVQEWQIKQNKTPFVRKEALALSPMIL